MGGRSASAPRRAALITYITAGHPSMAATEGALPALAAAGADIIEVGIPFSDPIADGPVIAAAMHGALERAVTPAGVFDLIGAQRSTTAGRDDATVRPPVVAMVSVSIVHRLGVAEFVRRAVAAGVDGLIVPDLDVDAELDASPGGRAPSLIECAADAGLDLALLVAPTTASERLSRIASASRGFVYVLARTGITGESGAGLFVRAGASDQSASAGRASARLADDIDEIAHRLARLRDLTDTPLAVGFGVSTPADVAALAEIADGVIVGTALVRRMGDAGGADDTGQAAARAAAEFVTPLAAAVRTTHDAATKA